MAVLNPAVPWAPFYRFKFNPSSFFTFPTNSSLIHTKKIRILARFARPTNRRNSLRKKLTRHLPRHLNEVASIPSTDNHDNTHTNYSNIEKDSVVDENSSLRVSEAIDGSSVDLLKIESLGESDLRNKLESWADQYKADSEFWGIGLNPIFTVFKSKEGKIENVIVNEDEILERFGIDPVVYRQNVLDLGFIEVNTKISHAKFLAREMESGNYKVPKNVSLAKVVVALERKSGFVESIKGFIFQSNFPMKKISDIGIIVLCGFFVIWATRALFVGGGEDKQEYTKLGERKEKEKLVKGNVEVIHDPLEMKMATVERPKLDKEELLSSIAKAKPFGDPEIVQEFSSLQDTKLNEFDAKVMEIRAMARRAREIEREDSQSVNSDELGDSNFDDLSGKPEVVEVLKKGITDTHVAHEKDDNDIILPLFFNDLKDNSAISDEEASIDDSVTQTSDSSKIKTLDGDENIVSDEINLVESDKQDPIVDINTENTENISKTVEVSDTIDGKAVKGNRGFGKKPRVIISVKEAKRFLSQKREKQEHHVQGHPSHTMIEGIRDEKETDSNAKQSVEKGNGVNDKTITAESNTNSEKIGSVSNKKWMEDNFQTLEPVLKKIGGGFRENYALAREKLEQELDITPKMDFSKFDEDDGELDWMKNDRLREIVFQVRDNELSGRDPFYLMDEEDKLAFYKGLEEKVEKENEKLSKLHEYLHANIENLDYGADGISVYDPPEKIIPRWKGPPINQKQTQNPEFLENFAAQRKSLVKGNFYGPDIENKDGLNSIDKIKKSPSNETILPQPDLTDQNTKSPETVIEGSDGSFRPGKKSGKEFWEHTKKWSEGFLESYNAESDPEIKATMKDIGKDLDRWITPKEIQEAENLMNGLPEKKKEFIEKKLNKVKREMELFGPQAVLSKYKEFGDQKKEDYLWWLDLPFVLCIELYTNENGEQRIGLYSLEMAKDLELDPKPIHVIAFEDASDCKNLCYIIQAHLEMLGNGNAFVVARPPKDAFREAKANGFSVTVMRKGELQLNVDQRLEEVEEEITEIGTKIYHDKIMGKQSVDMSALMKGVFGADKPSKRRRPKRELKRLAKQRKM